MKEYRVLMKVDGSWYRASTDGWRPAVACTYEDALESLERVKSGRERNGHPAEDYKIVSRDVTEWVDVNEEV